MVKLPSVASDTYLLSSLAVPYSVSSEFGNAEVMRQLTLAACAMAGIGNADAAMLPTPAAVAAPKNCRLVIGILPSTDCNTSKTRRRSQDSLNAQGISRQCRSLLTVSAADRPARVNGRPQ